MDACCHDARKALEDEAWKILAQKKMVDFLGNLWCRWQDEREYEDFAGYEDAIRKNLPGLALQDFTRRPFGFTVVLSPGHGLVVSITNKGMKAARKSF